MDTCPGSDYDGGVSAINFYTKEISVKIVYYGPGLCGKTTSLQTIYGSLPADRRPQLVSLATEVDRTIFFDFLPVTAYRIKDFNVRLQLYTVPGQVFYNATRKLVLNGVDGIVFVADSQRAMRESNLESLQNLNENLLDLGLEAENVPTVLQYNKRDVPDTMPVGEMDQLYNPRGLPSFATVATAGHGIFDALKTISQLVVTDLMRRGLGRQLREPEPTGVAAAGVSAAPVATPALSAPITAAVKRERAPVVDGFAAVQVPVAIPSPPVQATDDASRPLPAAPASASVPKAHASVPDTGSRAAPGLWPAGDVGPLGRRIDTALTSGDWREVLIAVDALLNHEAAKWAAAAGGAAGGTAPIGTYLLLRGAPGARFAHFWRSLQAAREGRSVTQSDAMSALILALEIVW